MCNERTFNKWSQSKRIPWINWSEQDRINQSAWREPTSEPTVLNLNEGSRNEYVVGWSEVSKYISKQDNKQAVTRIYSDNA